MYPADFAYARARSVEHALTILDHNKNLDPAVLAGGQSLLPMMKLRLAAPALLVDIGGLDELKGVTARPGGGLRIGALTTYRELQRAPGVARAYPAIADALAVLASPQVRARGTVGGCVAHGDPAADLPAVLLALGARVEIAGRAGPGTIPLANFLLGAYTTALAPGEIVTGVTLPAPAPAPAATGTAYEKFEQPASRLPLAGVCAVVEATGRGLVVAGVAVTGVASRPFFSSLTERSLPAVPSGSAIPEPVITESMVTESVVTGPMAAAGLTALSDHHASGPFRVHLAGVLARRAIARAADRAAAVVAGGP
jgi:aerobic carbon-monoxide dehydrogenase medium subunit